MQALRIAIWFLLIAVPAAVGVAIAPFELIGPQIPAAWPLWARAAAWSSIGGLAVLGVGLVLFVAAPVSGVSVRARVRDDDKPPGWGQPQPPAAGRRTTTIVNGGRVINAPPNLNRPSPAMPKPRPDGD